MKKLNKKSTMTVSVAGVKTRNSWSVKPYTRVHTPKTVYCRKGRRKGEYL